MIVSVINLERIFKKFNLLDGTTLHNFKQAYAFDFIKLITLFNIFADWKYCVIQCTGYLKSWAPAKIDLEEHEGDGDGEACNLSCLVAVGRLQSTIPTSLPKKPRLRSIKFVSRHAMDGKFLFVDQRLIF